MSTETDPPPGASADKESGEPEGQGGAPPRFKTVRRGLRTKEVDNFLLEIDAATMALEEELRAIRLEREGSQGPGEDQSSASGHPSKRLAAHLSELTSAAERGARVMVAQAREETTSIHADAESESERIVAEARQDAERTVEEAAIFLKDAKDQASSIVADLADRREQMLGGLQQIHQRMMGLLPDLQVALDAVAGAQGPTTTTEDPPIPPPPTSS